MVILESKQCLNVFNPNFAVDHLLRDKKALKISVSEHFLTLKYVYIPTAKKQPETLVFVAF
jgi:hypothetical protein